METTPLPSLSPREVARLLRDRRKLWLVPAIACGVLAAAYSLVMPRYWEASQALVVRQETAGSRGSTPGKFADLYEMRTMQETILELAKSQQVVVETLKAVDERMNGVALEPTPRRIEEFRNRLQMLPPHGGEFGKTEVFYFYVKDQNRVRAMELVSELCHRLDGALKNLRAERAAGLIAELAEQVALATDIHAKETQKLVEFESEVGGDLGELRMLHSGASGQSDLRQEAVQLEADMRKFETQVRETQQLLVLLRAAENDPQQLIATPNSLLSSQAALRRLKDGLVDAQLATARLSGTRSAEHPGVKAAVEAETQIRRDLHRELVSAIQGADVELDLGQQRVASTQTRLTNLQTRLGGLAQRRAEYSNRVAAVDNSRITLDAARQNLSTAKAAEAAAHSGSLVTRIDQPETGPYPAGPGRTAVTGAGAMGGLMLGLGLVFLTTGAGRAEGHPLASSRSSAESLRAERNLSPVPSWTAPLRPTMPFTEEPVALKTDTPPLGIDAWATPAAGGLAPATADQIQERVVFTDAASPSKKPSLPTAPGRLPTAGGTLPPVTLKPMAGASV